MKLSDIYYDSHFGEFEELFRQSGVPVHFRKGEAIPTDYKIRNIFYTVNGLSKYFFVHENGTEKVTGIFGPGTLIPYSLCLPVSEKNFVYKDYFKSQTLTDVDAICLKQATYHKLFESSAALRTANYDWIAFQHNRYEFETFFLSNCGAFTKVCNFLYSNSSLYNVYRQNGLILTQDDIGDIIGESHLDVARAFRNLRDLNIVSTSRGSVTILDKEKLFRLTSYLR